MKKVRRRRRFARYNIPQIKRELAKERPFAVWATYAQHLGSVHRMTRKKGQRHAWPMNDFARALERIAGSKPVHTMYGASVWRFRTRAEANAIARKLANVPGLELVEITETILAVTNTHKLELHGTLHIESLEERLKWRERIEKLHAKRKERLQARLAYKAKRAAKT